MIGVLVKVEQVPVVEEFFELFKTPWEFSRPNRAYDIVVTTVDDVPEIEARLLVAYGTGTNTVDTRYGIAAAPWHQGACVDCEGTPLPIYGKLLTFSESRTGVPCVTAPCGVAGLRIDGAGSTVIRLGYDVFSEVQFLLSKGQPVEHARVPALDLHIMMLRNWILEAGIPLVEIAPAPAGHDFLVCLTHDIDFVGIRRHWFDLTMWGFLYRSTAGALGNVIRGRLSIAQLWRTWRAVASLPFVYLGWAKDFWDPFAWYLQVERNLAATYYLIPFKRRPGENVPGPRGSSRATAYDITDVANWTATLMKAGCEVGVHGIDAWHDVDKGREERERIAAVTGESNVGVRMHWLLHDTNTLAVLERAGYAYDATAGYNETVGYRNGTTQVFRPIGMQTILELPLHIQDGALFYPQRLDLSKPQAEKRCQELIDHAQAHGGVLTVLWHDRSHGPERFWGDFYIRLVDVLRSLNGWFGTAAQVVSWFQRRRDVRFEHVAASNDRPVPRLRYDGEPIQPPLVIRVHRGSAARIHGESPLEVTPGFVDIPWDGRSDIDLNASPLKLYRALVRRPPIKLWLRS